MVDTAPLDAAERVELTIGLAESLYFEERYGAAAQLFESVRQRSALLGTPAHERVLDWWATSVDKQAQTRQVDERPAIYATGSRPHDRRDCGVSRVDGGRLLAGGGGAGPAATSSGPGMPRTPAGCARRSPTTAAPRSAPTSIGS